MGNREKEIYKVTLVGGVGNVALLAFKFVAGILGHSSAMIADAVHSLSDFITDIVVLVFVNISAKPQDETHDYGHGKYETVASFLIGLALAGAAAGIIISGGGKLYGWMKGQSLKAPGMLALWAALVSIVVKEALYRYTAYKGRKLESQAVVANAWHHRSDAFSSIAAAAGIAGAIFLGSNWTIMDPIASIIVGIMLVVVAVKILRKSIGELTDESLQENTEKEILDIIQSVHGVCQPHNLRTRRMGGRISIEAHIRMDGGISLAEAHDLTSEIEIKLKEKFGADTHVTLHMEPK
jgi:cation diffusion facilitator family transporter